MTDSIKHRCSFY